MIVRRALPGAEGLVRSEVGEDVKSRAKKTLTLGDGCGGELLVVFRAHVVQRESAPGGLYERGATLNRSQLEPCMYVCMYVCMFF